MRRKEIVHGTYAGYQGGCRCGLCLAARTEYNRLYRAGLRKKKYPIVHGTASGYFRKCRCAECVAAYKQYQRDYRARLPKKPKKGRVSKFTFVDGIPVSRICSQCKVNKPLSEFYKNSSAKYGVTTACISCMLSRRVLKPKRLTAIQVGHKVCTKCKIDKPISEYSINKNGRVRSDCNKCNADRVAGWHKNNPEKTREQSKRHRDREAVKNADKIAERQRIKEERRKMLLREKYRKPEIHDLCSSCGNSIVDDDEYYCPSCLKRLGRLVRQSRWIPVRAKLCPVCNKFFGSSGKYCSAECRRIVLRKRERDDVSRKIRDNIRKRLRDVLSGRRMSGSTVKLLGCTIASLRTHLESQFTEGMTWANYGFGNDRWHIDHIKPLNTFKLEDPEELAKACHYTNLRPLWQTDNLKRPKDGSDLTSQM